MEGAVVRVLFAIQLTFLVSLSDAHAQTLLSVTQQCTPARLITASAALSRTGTAYFQSHCSGCNRVRVRVTLRPSKLLKKSFRNEDLAASEAFTVTSSGTLSTSGTQSSPPRTDHVDFLANSIPIKASETCYAPIKYRIHTSYLNGTIPVELETNGDTTIPGTWK